MKKSLLLFLLFFSPFLNVSAGASLVDPSGQLVHHVLNVQNAPAAKAVAFSPDGLELWAALLLNKSHGITVFDTHTGLKTNTIDLEGGGGVEILFSPDGSKVYVTQMETAQIFELDAKTKKILRVFKTGSVWTKVAALSPDGTKLYASNWAKNDVSEIDLQTGTLIRKIKTVKTPRGIYVTQDNKYLYVAGFDNGEIQKIDLATGKGKIIFTTGGAMRHIISDEEKHLLYISDMQKRIIYTLDLTTDSVTEFAKTDRNPNTIVLSPDKKVLYVSCRGKNFSATNYYKPGPEWGSVLLFDTGSGKMLDAILGGNQPTALDISNDGTQLAFSDFLDAHIELFTVPPYETLVSGNGGRSLLYKKEILKK